MFKIVKNVQTCTKLFNMPKSVKLCKFEAIFTFSLGPLLKGKQAQN